MKDNDYSDLIDYLQIQYKYYTHIIYKNYLNVNHIAIASIASNIEYKNK